MKCFQCDKSIIKFAAIISENFHNEKCHKDKLDLQTKEEISC